MIQLIGLVLVLLALLDVFLTVLYARVGSGIFTPLVCKGVWGLFRAASLPLGSSRGIFLSFCGPVMLVCLAVIWAGLFIVGFALILWPLLGMTLVASSGATPTEFMAAFYTSAYCFTTLGIGDLVPKSSGARFIMVAEAALGFSFFTLTITYFLSIYNSLWQRNAFASDLHHKTGRTGNPADFLARLGPEDDFSNAAQELSNISSALSGLLEMHKHYPILHFYRFREIHYALSRMVLIAMDVATLAASALDQEKHRRFIRSHGIHDLWNSGMGLQVVITESFLQQKRLQIPFQPDAETRAMWKSHFSEGVRRLEEEGISIHPDREAAFERFLKFRCEWYPYVKSLSESMRHDIMDVHHGDREA